LMTHERGTNANDSGAHFYNVYECRDGEWISIAAIEPKFYTELLGYLEIDPSDLPAQRDKAHWPQMKEKFAAKFITKTRDEWCAIMEGSDACFAPVLTATEAPNHPHFKQRGTFATINGVAQPYTAPIFSRTKIEPPTAPRAPESVAQDGALADWMSDAEIRELLDQGGAE
jgi:alpha-methylacyl-CoA racemase